MRVLHLAEYRLFILLCTYFSGHHIVVAIVSVVIAIQIRPTQRIQAMPISICDVHIILI